MKTAFLSFKSWFVCLILLPFATANIVSQTPPDDTADIKTAVEGFHRALAQYDRPAALALLAPNALILESGESQTRAEYEREHLAEDIEFASATKTDAR